MEFLSKLIQILILILLLIGGGYLAYQIYSKRRARAKVLSRQLLEAAENFDCTLNEFYRTGDGTYPETADALSKYFGMVWNLNAEVTRLFAREHQNDTVHRQERTLGRFKAQMQLVQQIRDSEMMDGQNYGRACEEYLSQIQALSRTEALKIMDGCKRALLDTAKTDQCLELDPRLLLKCVWFFAMEKPYSAADLQLASMLFTKLYHGNHVDVLMAEVYAKQQIGGEEIVMDMFRGQKAIEHNKTTYGSRIALLASSLMWMQAYKAESAVLQGMLTSGMEMDITLQNRLHALSNGGGKAPDRHNVSSNQDMLYFDVSALSWRDDDFHGLFENLAFQDNLLSYSLAVRDEDKELMIYQGIALPEEQQIAEKINACFREEYGASASASFVACAALSGNSREEMTGILAAAAECPQLGILMHTARIGKKLTIKFYTLFMPDGSSVSAQRERALSLSKKLGHTASMWESSMKDTMLLALQQLLNQTSYSSGKTGAAAQEEYF